MSNSGHRRAGEADHTTLTTRIVPRAAPNSQSLPWHVRVALGAQRPRVTATPLRGSLRPRVVPEINGGVGAVTLPGDDRAWQRDPQRDVLLAQFKDPVRTAGTARLSAEEEMWRVVDAELTAWAQVPATPSHGGETTHKRDATEDGPMLVWVP
jgi:hypothetical protein